MKHGRRHQTLKEKVHTARFAQDAPGYRRPYDAIDVREPDAPTELPEPTTPLADRVTGKAKRGLRRLGVSDETPDTTE